jgi:endonuclease YncB( thermonuclease family)
MLKTFLATVAIAALGGSAMAQQQPANPSFPIPQTGVSFVTGDTWTQGGRMMRLYGVQSCIRGTTFTNAAGVKTDCGEASLAYLAAIVRDTKPSCAPIAKIDAASPSILVVCNAHVGSKTLDLGTVLITQGFAFAAFSNVGPVYTPYLVAESLAQLNRAGLWAAPDLPHPSDVLQKAKKR